MNDNNNDDFYKRIINEVTIVEGQNTFKWGSTFILVLAILSFIFVIATAYSIRDLLIPFDWVIFRRPFYLRNFCQERSNVGFYRSDSNLCDYLHPDNCIWSVGLPDYKGWNCDCLKHCIKESDRPKAGG